MSESKKQLYNNAYNKANYTGISFRINNTTEHDIKEMLDMQDNLKAYICKLIRGDIKRQKQMQRRVLLNNGDRKVYEDIDKYCFEVTEDLPFDNHYIVGFAEDIENAQILLGEFAARTPQHGKLRILFRWHDKELNCLASREVTDEVF